MSYGQDQDVGRQFLCQSHDIPNMFMNLAGLSGSEKPHLTILHLLPERQNIFDRFRA
jgi:hypothetical protein